MPWRVDRRPFARPVGKRLIAEARTLVIDLSVAGEWVVFGLVREWRRREQLPARPMEDDEAIELLRTRPERRQFLRVVSERRRIVEQAERAQVVLLPDRRARSTGCHRKTYGWLRVSRRRIAPHCRRACRRTSTTVRTCRWAPI